MTRGTSIRHGTADATGVHRYTKSKSTLNAGPARSSNWCQAPIADCFFPGATSALFRRYIGAISALIFTERQRPLSGVRCCAARIRFGHKESETQRIGKAMGECRASGSLGNGDSVAHSWVRLYLGAVSAPFRLNIGSISALCRFYFGSTSWHSWVRPRRG